MQLAQTPFLSGKNWEDATEKLGHRRRELRMVPISTLSLDPKDCTVAVEGKSLPMTELAAKQLAARLGITPGYVLKIDNEIAAENFNHFLPNARGSTQVVVEADRYIVGFLGERSVPVPMPTLIEQAHERLGAQGYGIQEWRYDSGGATFRLVNAKLKVEPRKGDIVRLGIDLLNRDNTEGGLSTRGIAYRLTCTNGATAPEPTGLIKQIRREGWRDPDARIQIAFNVVEQAIQIVREMTEHLPELTKEPIEWTPEDYDRNLAVIRSGLRNIDGAPIAGKTLAQTVIETMADEEKTGFGLYNALTRIGRDSIDVTRRGLFESAGFQFALKPADPLRALHEAIDAFSQS